MSDPQRTSPHTLVDTVSHNKPQFTEVQTSVHIACVDHNPFKKSGSIAMAILLDILAIHPDFLRALCSPHPANAEKRHRLYYKFWGLAARLVCVARQNVSTKERRED